MGSEMCIRDSFIADHYPFGAITMDNGGLRIGYPSIAQAFGSQMGDGVDAVPPMPSVSAVISGHIHLLQYAAMAGHPVQLTVGMSGTLEDEPPAPADAPQGAALPSGVAPGDLATRYGHFGYALLDRLPHGAWAFTAYDRNGTRLLKRIIPRRGG